MTFARSFILFIYFLFWLSFDTLHTLSNEFTLWYVMYSFQLALPERYVSAALYCWLWWQNKLENVDGQRWLAISILVACK